MKSMKQECRAVINGLKKLVRMTEQIGESVDQLHKAKPVHKHTTKKASTWTKMKKRTYMKKRATKKTYPHAKMALCKTGTHKPTSGATGKVIGIVKKFKNGIAVPRVARQCHYNKKKVRDILCKAFAQGKVKRVARGVYACA